MKSIHQTILKKYHGFHKNMTQQKRRFSKTFKILPTWRLVYVLSQRDQK